MSMIAEITKVTLADGFRAGNSTVDQVEQVLAANYEVRKFVIVRASADNTGENIFVGPKGHAADGFQLAAGDETPPIPVDNLNKVYLVGSADGLAYSWISI